MKEVSSPAVVSNLTDRQLMQRWQCSSMKLFRLRRRGLLKSFKVGGFGLNLTRLSEVERVEAEWGAEAANDAA